MKSKLKFIIPGVVLLVLGGVYKFVLAAPPAKAKPPKVDGQVYILPKEFVVTLADGQYAKFNVALVLNHSQATAPAAGGEGAAAAPPDGYGTLEQEAVVRDIVTDDVSGAGAADLTKRKKRAKLKKELLKDLLAKTDVKVEEVLLTDIAVQ
jgi:flagellar FliL protein